MASRIRGIISTRRLLKRAPDAIRAELASVLKDAGPEMAGAISARAPRGKTGKLLAGIAWKFYPSTLRLVVGFIGKRLNSKLFYARILELGRRAQVVTVSRRRRGAPIRTVRGRKPIEDVAAVYQLRVKARAPEHFVYTPQTDLRRVIGGKLNGIWDRALARIAGGGDD